MTPEDIAGLLEQLKLLTEEADAGGISPGCDQCGLCPGAQAIPTREFTDEQLLAFLALEGYDLRRTAYAVLMRKAQNSQVTLASGIVLPDNSAYWLRLASMQRRGRTGLLPRADDVKGGGTA